jgi:hypothetical protein
MLRRSGFFKQEKHSVARPVRQNEARRARASFLFTDLLFQIAALVHRACAVSWLALRAFGTVLADSPPDYPSLCRMIRAQVSSVTSPLIQCPRSAPRTASVFDSPAPKAMTGFLGGRRN